MAKFEKIKGIYSFDDIPENAKIGQWFIDNNSIRGQYLGKTKYGTTVINSKRFKGKIDYVHMLANRHCRQFAIKFGK